MGPEMNAKTDDGDIAVDIEARRARQRDVLIAAHHLFGDDALIDADTSAAGGHMSRSWWEEEVREQRAPQPVVRRPRCTRWRYGDVREFWRKFAQGSSTDAAAHAKAIAKATKASAVARERRLERDT
jgi:hypothetical protein